MSFKARRLAGTVLIVSLFIQMQIAANGYASRGTKIAFTCVGVDGNRDICVMDGDGGNEVRLTDDPAWDQGPSWSPDGTRIVFYRGHHIYVMDSDGQNLMELTGPLGGTDPAWSPDGAKIAFTRFKALKNQIWVMDADGGNEVQLTQWGENYNPAWSPDGDTIAYSLWEWGISMTINLMTPEGKHLKQLTEDDGTYRCDADWFAPVGRSVSPAANFVTIWGKIKVPASVRR